MDNSEERTGQEAPEAGNSSHGEDSAKGGGAGEVSSAGQTQAEETGASGPGAGGGSPSGDGTPSYSYDEDPYAHPAALETVPVTAPPVEPVAEERVPAVRPASGGPPAPPPPPTKPEDDDGDEDEDGMLRMSFLDHLEELRTRILRALMGVGAAFITCLVFANELWLIVEAPAHDALLKIGVKDPRLAQITPMEVFNTVWIKTPMLVSLFVASPWVLYQVWAFIAPGLYKRERRWAAPFVICSAGLFILGGVFAYFVAFRYGLAFLLGIGRDIHIQPLVSVTEYFDLFVNVMLGIGLVFELPVLIFFLTLLRIVTPSFLLRNVRYAILIITIIAAIVTPTPDIVNMMIFAVPMYLLFFLGVFASYLLILHREKRRFPWGKVLPYVGIVLALMGGALAIAIYKYGYHLVKHWPFLVR